MRVTPYMRRLVYVRHAGYFLVTGTMYLFVTAIFVRMIFMTDYATMIDSLDFLSDNLLSGGIFAVIIYLLKDGVSNETVKAVKQWRGKLAAQTTKAKENA